MGGVERQKDDYLVSSFILETEMTHFIGSFENTGASFLQGNEFHRPGPNIPLSVLGLRNGLFLKNSISLKKNFIPVYIIESSST